MAAKEAGGREPALSALVLSLTILASVTLTAFWSAAPALAASCGAFAAPAQAEPRITTAGWAQRWLAPQRLHQVQTGVGVRVAVLDTGVDAGHPQLATAVDVGWDSVARESGARLDCGGHGTAIASLVAGRPDGDAALIGVAPGARIVPIRVSNDATGATGYRDVTPGVLADGIRHALALGVAVIDVSFAVHDDPELRAAVAEALNDGVVVVAAVGDKVTGPTYPAAYEGVIAVGAVDRTGARWSDSGIGPQLTLMAPGAGLVAAARAGGHLTIDGTAAAAAIVSGAAALLRAAHPQWTNVEVAQQLIATADGTPGGPRSTTYGYGTVNPYRALVEPVTTPEPSRSPAPAPEAAREIPVDPGLHPLLRRALLWAAAAGVISVALAVGHAAVVARRQRREA